MSKVESSDSFNSPEYIKRKVNEISLELIHQKSQREALARQAQIRSEEIKLMAQNPSLILKERNQKLKAQRELLREVQLRLI